MWCQLLETSLKSDNFQSGYQQIGKSAVAVPQSHKHSLWQLIKILLNLYLTQAIRINMGINPVQSEYASLL